MKILVSACAVGQNCKYNGKNNLNKALVEYLNGKDVIYICPEMLVNMPTPRPCTEIVNGKVIDENGCDVDLEYRKAVECALERIQGEDISVAILQSRSPTCGVNQIYDGTFTGKLTKGHGLFAQALLDRGYQVKDVEDFKECYYESQQEISDNR